MLRTYRFDIKYSSFCDGLAKINNSQETSLQHPYPITSNKPQTVAPVSYFFCFVFGNQLMVNWWFGARWFRFLGSPKMKGIGLLRGTPKIPNHRAPFPTNQPPADPTFEELRMNYVKQPLSSRKKHPKVILEHVIRLNI